MDYEIRLKEFGQAQIRSQVRKRGLLVPKATHQTRWNPGLYADMNVFVLKEMAQTHSDFTPGPLAPGDTRLSIPSPPVDPGQGSLRRAS